MYLVFVYNWGEENKRRKILDVRGTGLCLYMKYERGGHIIRLRCTGFDWPVHHGLLSTAAPRPLPSGWVLVKQCSDVKKIGGCFCLGINGGCAMFKFLLSC